MSDTDPYDVAQAAPGIRLTTPDTVGNPAAADAYLRQHRQAVQQRQGDVDATMTQQQDANARMAKLLDDTTEALKAARTGRSSLPLLAMGAGMLSSPGNFGQQVGAGLRMMVPTIEADRKDDEDHQYRLAQLAIKRAGMEEAPLKDKLAYLRAMQLGDMSAIRAIEAAVMRTVPNAQKEADKERTAVQKAIQDSMAEARRAFEAGNKEMYTTDEEAQAAIRAEFLRQIAIRKSGGLNIPDEVVQQVLGAGATPVQAPGTAAAPRQRKSYFDPPTDDAAAAGLGLPPKPTGYIYDAIGPKDRVEELKKQQALWGKATADWDAESDSARTLQDKLSRLDAIATKKPDIFGPQHGIPSGVIPKGFRSKEAQEFQALAQSINLNRRGVQLRTRTLRLVDAESGLQARDQPDAYRLDEEGDRAPGRPEGIPVLAL
jgi:hypothetical protein